MNRGERDVHATFSDHDAALKRLREAIGRARAAEPVATIGRELANGFAAASPASVPAEAGEAISGALLEDLRRQVSAAVKQALREARPVTDAAVEVITPALEHAASAAGSHEGIRLWMVSCGELVTKHQARAEAAEADRDRFREHARILGEQKAEWLCEPCHAIHPWRDGDRFTAACPDCGSAMIPTSTSVRALREARTRANVAEARLGAIADRCRQRLDAAIPQGPVSQFIRAIQGIIGGAYEIEPTPDAGSPAPVEVGEAIRSAALQQFEGIIRAAVDQQMGERLAVIEAAVRVNERARIRRGALVHEMVLQHPVDGDRVAVLTLDLEQIIGAEDGT